MPKKKVFSIKLRGIYRIVIYPSFYLLEINFIYKIDHAHTIEKGYFGERGKDEIGGILFSFRPVWIQLKTENTVIK